MKFHIFYFYLATNNRDIIPELNAQIARLFHVFSTFQALNKPQPMIPAFARPNRVVGFSLRRYLVAEVASIEETARDIKA